MKKITLATAKSFIKKNFNALYIKEDSTFDGMIDGLNWNKNSQFIKAQLETKNFDRTLGIKGAWFVGSSRDFFYSYECDNFIGFKVSNSCGQFYITIKK